MKNSRSGFTMIELIFVIVVIGILFSIALIRLMATRDDAKLSIDISNMAICLKDVGGQYIATATKLAKEDSDPCKRVVCYTFDFTGDNFIVTTKPGNAPYCSLIDTVGGHLAQSYNFAGSSISQ